MDIYDVPRKSFTAIGNVYFWTSTINCWFKLLADDDVKEIIVGSLRNLSDRNKIKLYAFVIMPNHIHLIWEELEKNGKESAHASFLKFTAHEFKKYLRAKDPASLRLYAVNAHNKNYEFWQRDPLAFELTKRKTALQKLEYIHMNPLGANWNLCDAPAKYKYSSAYFYETGIDNFGFLHHLLDIF